jgi:ribonuclease P protein component
MKNKDGRINKKKDFDNIFKNGRSAKGSFLLLKFAKNDLEILRKAFLVSKKVSSKAVIRNKVRRRLQESLRLFGQDKLRGLDIVLVALPKIKEKNFFQINEELVSLLKKIQEQ